MISCTEFIPAYSELFKYLDHLGGKKAVMRYWEYLSDRYLGNLVNLVQAHGLAGCYEYWNKSLNEEAADFVMTLDEVKGEFNISMRHCPSKGMLNEIRHLEPYKDYCGHCDVLYRRKLEPLGYRCDMDLSGTGMAQCTFKVTGKGLPGGGRMSMTREASQNKYLHKEFHIAMNYGLDYLGDAYGDDHVIKYLRQFAAAYYAPLKERLASEGLKEIAAHYNRIYEIEESTGDLACVMTDSELSLRVKKCPAIDYMKSRNAVVSRFYTETLRTINSTICEGTNYNYLLISYDTGTGASFEKFAKEC